MHFSIASLLLAILPSLIPAVVAIPDSDPNTNTTLSARGGPQVLYLCQCNVRNTPGADPPVYEASFAAWYADTNLSQDYQYPDSLSNEYRDWARGGLNLIFDGTYQTMTFPDSGTQITTGIESGAEWRGVNNYAGVVWRSDGYQFSCRVDNNRVLFPNLQTSGNNWRVMCWASYYCM